MLLRRLRLDRVPRSLNVILFRSLFSQVEATTNCFHHWLALRCERCSDPCLSGQDPCNTRLNNQNRCVSVGGSGASGRRLLSGDHGVAASQLRQLLGQEQRVCGTFTCTCEGEYWRLSADQRACDPVCENKCSSKDPCLMVLPYFLLGAHLETFHAVAPSFFRAKAGRIIVVFSQQPIRESVAIICVSVGQVICFRSEHRAASRYSRMPAKRQREILAKLAW